MKKLLLVTLMAVAASWLLSEARDNRPAPPAAPSPPEKAVVVHAKAAKKAKKAARPVAYQGQGEPARPAIPARRPTPDWFPKSEVEEEAGARPDASGQRVIVGRLSASEDKAREELRKLVGREVSEWIAVDVPASWPVPDRFLDAMARDTYVQETTRSLDSITARSAGELVAPAGSESAASPKAEIPGLDDLYTLYRAGQKLDFSDRTRARIVHAYRQELASGRMKQLGGGLALLLAALALISGYIKADEATRGYYTNRLRLLAAAGAGVAGVVAYRYWS